MTSPPFAPSTGKPILPAIYGFDLDGVLVASGTRAENGWKCSQNLTLLKALAEHNCVAIVTSRNASNASRGVLSRYGIDVLHGVPLHMEICPRHTPERKAQYLASLRWSPKQAIYLIDDEPYFLKHALDYNITPIIAVRGQLQYYTNV